MEDVVLVLGTGQMGPGIALSFALAGYPVILSGRSAERLAGAARDMEAAFAGVSVAMRHDTRPGLPPVLARAAH